MAKDRKKQTKGSAKKTPGQGKKKGKNKNSHTSQTRGSGSANKKAGEYEDRTKTELLDMAKKAGIKGRYSMRKNELIDALQKG